MKKIKLRFYFLFFIFFLYAVQNFNAQEIDSRDFADAHIANRYTALRCAESARNMFVEGDYQGAVAQVDIGLAYDEKISDLWYIKAASLDFLLEKRSQVLDCAREAYQYNDWTFFSEEQGHALYAKILIQTNDAQKAYNILGKSYSSDIEFLKAQACYITGDVARARRIINSSSKIYPDDSRFPNLFFKWESKDFLYKNEKIDSGAISIAQKIIPNLQKWEDESPQILFYASFFTSTQEEGHRLFAQFIAEKPHIPECLAFACEKKLLTDRNVFEELKRFAEEGIEYKVFRKIVSCITDEQVKTELIKYLTDFEGTIYFDNSDDFISDLSVKYKNGRPVCIQSDANQDEVIDWQINCSFGNPETAFIKKNDVHIVYKIYPNIENLKVDGDTEFFLLQNSLQWNPVEFKAENILEGFSFYFAFLSNAKLFSFDVNDYQMLLKNSNRAVSKKMNEAGVFEKYFLMHDGIPAKITYLKNGFVYGISYFENDVLVYRKLDLDYDGVFELTEYFEFDENNKVATKAESQSLYEELFGTIKPMPGLYLKKVCFDRNGNGFTDCQEEFFENKKKVTWYDGMDVSIVYQKTLKNDDLIEECMFVNPVNNMKVYIYCLNSEPLKLTDMEDDFKIEFDENTDCYWIGSVPDKSVLEYVKHKIGTDTKEGDVKVFEFAKIRIVVAIIGEKIFAQVVE
ncbi:MAG: hypothetical protein ACTTHG_07870 [Treponemataceae bacterium]